MIFHWIVLDLYAYDLHKNAEKPGVISFLSQIFCQKAVSTSSLDRAPLTMCDPLMISCVCLKGMWGVDGGLTLLPTHLRQKCNPLLLVNPFLAQKCYARQWWTPHSQLYLFWGKESKSS